MAVDRTEVISRRFREWLRRRWWTPVAAAVVVGGLAATLLRSSGYESSISFAPVLNSAVLQAAGLEGDTIAKALPISADAVAIDGKSMKSRAEQAAGTTLDVVVQYIKETDRVEVTVGAPTKEAVEKAKQFYSAQIVKIRSQRFSSASQAFLLALNSSNELLNTRIKTLDDEITALPAATPGEVTAALINERASVLSQQRDTAVRVSAVQSLSTRPDEVVVISSSNDILPRSGHLITTIGAGLLAAVLVLVGGYLLAIFDRRVRTPADVHLGLESEELPIVTFERGRGDARVLAVLTGLARSRQVRTVYIVPVDSSSNADRLVSGLALANGDTDVSTSIVARGTLDEDVVALSNDVVVVLLSNAGRTTIRDLTSLVNDLAVGGAAPAALLIER